MNDTRKNLSSTQRMKLHAVAAKKAAKCAAARSQLMAGSSRARVTTANARWARAAEARDLYARELAELGIDV
jgi:hypothetical protein